MTSSPPADISTLTSLGAGAPNHLSALGGARADSGAQADAPRSQASETVPALAPNLSTTPNVPRGPKPWVVRYDEDSYVRLTKLLGLREDVRGRSWRGAYRGVLA